MTKRLQLDKKWLSHLESDEEKKEFQMRLLQNKDLFQRLFELIDIMQKENAKDRSSKTSYAKPAWSEFQADANGFERALTDVLTILRFTKD